MVRWPRNRFWLVPLLLVSPILAQDDAGLEQRLKLMQTAVGSLEPESRQLKSKPALEFAREPLLRYSDPTRGGVKEEAANNVLLDAGVWRLGTEGRPTALVTVEIYEERDGTQVLSFEFLSLTESPFTLQDKSRGVRWDATASGLSLKELPDAPRPAATAAARLTQMRQMARRFAAREQFNKQSLECRLIAQPIDRYESAAEKIVDGAIFALANGTNPEIGIVLEAVAGRWQYGVIRLSSAQTVVSLDGQQIISFEQFDRLGRSDGPYNSGSYKIKIAR
jgi:hypothetical protein